MQIWGQGEGLGPENTNTRLLKFNSLLRDEAYSEPCQTSKVEIFVETVNEYKP